MENAFFERFSALCKDRNETPNSVAKIIGASSGSVTAWKKGTAPRNATLTKIADFFGVSTDYLLGKDAEKKPTPIPESEHLVNIVKIAGRDGSYVEKRLTDDQVQALRAIVDQFPDASDAL